jgi:dTMP kinase
MIEHESSNSGDTSGPGRGLLIVFEGIDGSGKSTLAGMLAEHLKTAGLPVVLTSEPSDGPTGQLIRSLKARPEPQEEARLFTEDRRDHVTKTIRPALARGMIVICDRYYYSSAAYQGAKGVDTVQIVDTNLSFAPMPDVTFLLSLPLDVALSRIRDGRPDGSSCFEAREDLEAVDAIYRNLDDPLLRRIDATAPPEEALRQVLNILREMGLEI